MARTPFRSDAPDMGWGDVGNDNYSILEQLVQYSERNPKKCAITFVSDKTSGGPAAFDERHLTYQQLISSARSMASYLAAECDLQAGDRVLLLFSPGLEFYKAFVACLLGGFVPVPVCPPQPHMLEAQLQTLNKVADSSASKVILSNRMYKKVHTWDASLLGRAMSHRTRSVSWPKLTWHIIEDIEHRMHQNAKHKSLYLCPEAKSCCQEPSRIVWLQYTSGSTGMPKGIMVSYENLLYQMTGGMKAVQLGEGSVFCSWLPHYHDFGLVTAFMCTLAAGGRLVQCSPLDFIKRPACWLDMITNYGGTHTASPDFGYSLVTRKVTAQEKQRLRLSSLQFAMSGAEPVQQATMEAFFATFSPAGFQVDMFNVVYGLAEHVAGVTTRGRTVIGVDRDQLDKHGRVVVVSQGTTVGNISTRVLTSCGVPEPVGTIVAHIVIVDPETLQARQDGWVGEIWVNSPCKALGYLGDLELTKRTFQARVAGDECGEEFLRTGDLGFMHDGELFVCGRLKDMFIINGSNIYPNDVEDSVRQAHQAIRRGGIAVFAVDLWDKELKRNREAVLVLVEIEKSQQKGATQTLLKDMVACVRDTIMRDFGIHLHVVAVLAPGSVTKTTSGKVSRSACKKAYLAGQYDARQRHVLLLDEAQHNYADTASQPHCSMSTSQVSMLPGDNLDGQFPHKDSNGNLTDQQQKRWAASSHASAAADCGLRGPHPDSTKVGQMANVDLNILPRCHLDLDDFLDATEELPADPITSISSLQLRHTLLSLPSSGQVAYMEGAIQDILRSVLGDLGTFRRNREASFANMGLQSVEAAACAQKLYLLTGLQLPPYAMFQHPSVRELAELMLGLLKAEPATQMADAHETEVPIQEDGPSVLVAMEF